MLFNTLAFALFFVVVFSVDRVVVSWGRLRVGWLLAASYLFYASWSPWFLLLLLASTLLDYQVGAALGRVEAPRSRRALLWASIVGNLGLLAIFKYGNFILDNVEVVLAATGSPTGLPRVPAELPVGISFYTFQTLSYTIERYRRRIEPARSLPEFALYVAFFPQLVAGPIVRAREFLPQLASAPRLSRADIGRGLAILLGGLVKKMVIADSIRHFIVDPCLSAPQLLSAPEALAALWAFYVQLYCDFSGYTDVAIGAALLLGFRLPENFRRPGLAPSPLAHWQRWHITLQSWLRDYVYIPLGGSRNGRARTLGNIVVVFTLGGVWHGAGWPYALMGLYNGLLAAGWRVLRPVAPETALGRTGSTLLSTQLIVLSMVGMRPYTLAEAGAALAALTRWSAPSSGLFDLAGLPYVAAGVALHVTPIEWRDRLRDWAAEAPAFALAVGLWVTLGVCSVYADQADAFYYFQF